MLWYLLQRKLHALSGAVVPWVNGEDRAELTWVGFGISKVWIGKPLPPPGATQFLPLPRTQGKGRAGLKYSCYTQPASTLKMISVVFPILCFTFDGIKASDFKGWGKITKYHIVCERWETFTLFVITGVWHPGLFEAAEEHSPLKTGQIFHTVAAPSRLYCPNANSI